MYIVLIIGGIFLLLKSGAFSSFGIGGVATPLAGGQPAPPSTVPTAIAVQGTGQLSASQQNAFSAIQASNTALAAIPVVGPALSAVASVITKSLIAASQRRAQEATSENTAVAAAVPGWDQGVLQIQNAYNSGQISATQASSLVDVLWTNYWNECGPKVQPGRNGCQSGQMSKSQADQQFPGMKQCSGSWGAACCVGYADLANGANSIKAALTQTENTGSPAVASIPAVYASKYGGTNRAAYTLTFTRPSTTFSL